MAILLSLTSVGIGDLGVLLAVSALPLGAHVLRRRSAREFGDVFLAG